MNLDVAPGSRRSATVGGERLDRRDPRGLQPRVGMAWRPVAGSSLVIRAGYGVYRNTSVYQPIATLLAQQSPLSTALSVENTAANPLRWPTDSVAARRRRPIRSRSIPTFASATRRTGRHRATRSAASLTVEHDVSRLARQPPDAGVRA